MVEIGTSHNWRPTGGGTGTVVIDLVPDEKNAIQQSETFDITVAVGSDDKNGKRIAQPDHISIKIP